MISLSDNYHDNSLQWSMPFQNPRFCSPIWIKWDGLNYYEWILCCFSCGFVKSHNPQVIRKEFFINDQATICVTNIYCITKLWLWHFSQLRLSSMTCIIDLRYLPTVSAFLSFLWVFLQTPRSGKKYWTQFIDFDFTTEI